MGGELVVSTYEPTKLPAALPTCAPPLCVYCVTLLSHLLPPMIERNDFMRAATPFGSPVLVFHDEPQNTTYIFGAV